jgi:hypothetical protein
MVSKVKDAVILYLSSVREYYALSFSWNSIGYLAAMVSLLVVLPSFSPCTLESEPECASLSVLPRFCVTSPMILETISLVRDSTVLAAISLQESASNCDS